MVGDRLFEVESGIIVGWFNQCIDEFPTELFPYHWDEVGQPAARVVYGKGSGLPSVTAALEAIGIEAEEEQMRELIAAISSQRWRRRRCSRSRRWRDSFAGAVPSTRDRAALVGR